MRRRSGRDEVLAKHLRIVGARRAALADALERLPSAEERDTLRGRDERLALVHRGFGMLATTWRLTPAEAGPVPLPMEARVLAQARSTAAVLAVRLQQREDRLDREDRADLAAAIALHHYLDTAIGVIGGAPEDLVRAATRDAVVAKHLRLLRTRMRDLELILTGRAPIIVPTLDEQTRFQAELREDDLLERGFTELLPKIWPSGAATERRVGLVDEARVLVQLRAASARLVLALQQGDREPVGDRLAVAGALFRYAHRTLAHFDFDENEMLPGGFIRYERIVAYAMFGQRWGSI